MTKQKRIEDYGINIGRLPKGPRNKITDVPGVQVGHYTIDESEIKTGITAIMPTPKNIFQHKLIAASHVINGYGKTIGLVQLDELGLLESPILLTNTLCASRVADALVSYTLKRCAHDEVSCLSFSPVVGECNDSYLNAINQRVITHEHVFEAIEQADDDFMEGSVGAGKGMSCHNLKGGIGSASRVLELAGGTYTLGALVLANYGTIADLTIDGEKVGSKIKLDIANRSEVDKGSIMIVLATNLPLSDRQLKRVCRRAVVGLARVGSYIGHGSGDVVLSFTTHEMTPSDNSEGQSILLVEQLDEHLLETVFRAAAEATEESILNALITADETTGVNGHTRYALKDFWRK